MTGHLYLIGHNEILFFRRSPLQTAQLPRRPLLPPKRPPTAMLRSPPKRPPMATLRSPPKRPLRSLPKQPRLRTEMLPRRRLLSARLTRPQRRLPPTVTPPPKRLPNWRRSPPKRWKSPDPRSPRTRKRLDSPRKLLLNSASAMGKDCSISEESQSLNSLLLNGHFPVIYLFLMLVFNYSSLCLSCHKSL